MSNPMRELILKMSISIDGFVADANSGLSWIFGHDAEATAWTLEVVWDAGLHIMGSRTFRDMAHFWPTSTEVFAAPMNQIPKAVFSRQGKSVLDAAGATLGMRDALASAGATQSAQRQPGAESWAQAYVATGSLTEEIGRLKAQQGKPIIAHGGAAFARSLIAAGLVDQYDLLVHPVALGKGLPVFSDLAAPKRLKLVSSTAFPKGSVAQIYRQAATTKP
ncbi:MAG TPA: dihydrofolate reductase family protein [Steroidobacteraceae bacterium]|nr:dihydrofolate reductase family protein [Steroidobacteraceae bacterium]